MASDTPIIMTGHQPELYHPGVWVKDFLVDRFSRELHAVGVDLIVDSDTFQEIGAAAPCLGPGLRACRATLVEADVGACFACTPVPPRGSIEDFCAEVDRALATLPSTEPRTNFARFAECLLERADEAQNVGELITFARRCFEAPVGTQYLELSVTSMSDSSAFALFVLDIATRAAEFRLAYNAELDAFRAATNTRTAAQPFPNLECAEDRCELPFWLLGGGRRRTLWVGPAASGAIALYADAERVASIAADDQDACAALLREHVVAPKALALTLFARVFVADLFIHGTGGARYDRVTDGVIRRHYGFEPPEYAVASLTEHLRAGIQPVSDAEVARSRERLNRYEHNPDALLDEMRFDDPNDRATAAALAAKKTDLVAEISREGADRKATGRAIRDVNATLRELLAPLGEQLRMEAARLQAAHDEARILEDRTYPFCYWTPEVIAGRVG